MRSIVITLTILWIAGVTGIFAQIVLPNGAAEANELLTAEFRSCLLLGSSSLAAITSILGFLLAFNAKSNDELQQEADKIQHLIEKRQLELQKAEEELMEAKEKALTFKESIAEDEQKLKIDLHELESEFVQLTERKNRLKQVIQKLRATKLWLQKWVLGEASAAAAGSKPGSI